MAAKFEINEQDDGTFTFDLKAANGEVIASSQVYSSRTDAMNGIMAVREAAPVAELPPGDGDHLLHMQ
jgi:uncharacterized protein YegP (UPF0339 family)